MGGKDSVPIFERFFLGGINNLRGWEWADIGPKNKYGEILGGYKYVVLTGELLFPVVEKYGMRGVLFIDSGNSYREKETSISAVSDRRWCGSSLEFPHGPLADRVGV